MKLDWGKYIAVAERFQHKAKPQDRDDLKQDIILRLAQVARNKGHKPFTEAGMIRIASYAVADYWRTQYRHTNGLDCGSCSQKQRRDCHKGWAYAECPKAIKVESLSKPITDDNGHLTELGELIADDRAIDVDAWLDARAWLLGCPKRLVEIANKVTQSEALSDRERQYLWYWRKAEQKSLNLS
jgi:DNA-directed RNA polymerase specialized sigma24 family protein